MATSIKILNVTTGTLTTTPTDVYTATSPKTALVTSVVVSSTSAALVFFLKAVTSAGIDVFCYRYPVTIANTPYVMEVPIPIGAGEKIQLVNSSGSSNYKCVVFGIERD